MVPLNRALHSFTRHLPGFAPGAFKRNVIVVLLYLLVFITTASLARGVGSHAGF